MDKWKSLLDQNEELKKKWGGDTLNYDIKSAISGYQPALKEWNDATTTAERKAEISSIYGDITKWDNETAYDDYMSDVNYIRNIDALNTSATGAMDAAKQAESRAMQYADTRRQLMQKYIPETLLAQGMANTGYTAQALLDAENKYNQYVHGAMSNRATAEQDTMQAYQDALRTYKADRDEKAYERFLQREETENTLKMLGIEMVDSGDTPDKIANYLKVQGASQKTIDEVVSYYNDEMKRIENEIEEQKGAAANPIVGQVYKNIIDTDIYYSKLIGKDIDNLNETDRFSLTDGTGQAYTVKAEGGVVTDEDVKAFIGDTRNAVFLYRDKLYYVAEDGSIVRLYQKGWKSGYNDILDRLQKNAGKVGQ